MDPAPTPRPALGRLARTAGATAIVYAWTGLVGSLFVWGLAGDGGAGPWAISHGVLWGAGMLGIGLVWRAARRRPAAPASPTSGDAVGVARETDHLLVTTQRDLEAAVTRKDALQTELDEFLHRASHDLMGPVRNIVSFCDLLADDLGDEVTPGVEADLRFLTDAAVRVRALVEGLLALSRVNRAVPVREPIALEDCVGEALRALRDELEDAGARIHWASLPIVVGDARLLTQVFLLLFANALKFRGAEAPDIEVIGARAGDEWTIGVRDNGIGLDPLHEEEIFAPFGRLHGVDEHEGPGLGLALCRRIVAHHGGRIWVESAPGCGACFRFTLPAPAAAGVCAGERPGTETHRS